MPSDVRSLFDPYKTIILDCDGVILDSNTFKNKVFEDILRRRNYRDPAVQAFMDYHKKNGGISRYAKFEYFQREILKQTFREDLHQELLNEFAEECRVQYLATSFTEGFIPLIEKLTAMKKDVFIASGSDEAELRYVFRERKSDHHFKAIYGSPVPKIDIVRSILKDHTDCIFIGDSVIDLEIAVKLKISFIALKGYSDNAEALEKSAAAFLFPVFNNFSEVIS